MGLYLPHADEGFDVTFHDNTKEDDFYTCTSRFVVWISTFPKSRQVMRYPRMILHLVITPTRSPP